MKRTFERLNNKEKLDNLINFVQLNTKIKAPKSIYNFKWMLNRVFRFLDTDIDSYEEIDKSLITFKNLKHLAHYKHYCFIIHIIKLIFKEEIDPIELKDIEYKIKLEKNYNLDYISTKDLDKLYELANDEMKLIMMILLSTGMRASALANIKRKNIDFINNTMKTIEKNNKEVTFNIVHDKIKDLIIKTELFDKELKYSKLKYLLNKLKTNIENGKRIHLHAFRHTFAKLCLKNKINFIDIQGLLNHSTLEITKNIYIKEKNSDISKRIFGNVIEDENFPVIWKELNLIKV